MNTLVIISALSVFRVESQNDCGDDEKDLQNSIKYSKIKKKKKLVSQV